MKKFIALISVLMLIGLFVRDAKAQEKEELWLVSEEVVYPEKYEQYVEVSKELIELCKAENFPYSYNLWSSGPFHFALWYPIEELNDITKIENAWDGIVEKFGEENFHRFQECIKSTEDKVMANLPDLYYEHEIPRLSEEETGYCYWQVISAKKGYEKKIEELFSKAAILLKEKDAPYDIYIGKGKIGYKQPVYFAWSYGKDRTDFRAKQKEFFSVVGEDWTKLNSEIVNYIDDISNVDEWWNHDLSYQPEK